MSSIPSCRKPSGTSARVLRLSLMCGNARDERRDKEVYNEMERSSATWRSSKRINSKLLNCQFHVIQGAPKMQLLEAIKQHVSSSDSFGTECTRRTYSIRAIFVQNAEIITEKARRFCFPALTSFQVQKALGSSIRTTESSQETWTAMRCRSMTCTKDLDTK